LKGIAVNDEKEDGTGWIRNKLKRSVRYRSFVRQWRSLFFLSNATMFSTKFDFRSALTKKSGNTDQNRNIQIRRLTLHKQQNNLDQNFVTNLVPHLILTPHRRPSNRIRIQHFKRNVILNPELHFSSIEYFKNVNKSYNQCLGSGSMRIRIYLASWIRVRIELDFLDRDPYWQCGSGSRRAKICTQK